MPSSPSIDHNRHMPLYLRLLAVCIGIAACAAEAAREGETIERMIFEEQRIEGKIRRPQLVLIKADQRPDFSPMIIQSMGKNRNITEQVTPSVIEESPYDDAFQFNNKRIRNYVP